MFEESFLRVPVGPDASTWVTVNAERSVLAVGRTVTSTVRVLAAMEQFRDDLRVQVVFAVNDSSPFHDGVRRLLDVRGARLVPWSQIGSLHFDAAVTASENTELTSIGCPILVLPHGIGFNKMVSNSRDSGRRLSGSVRVQDLAERRVLIAVSHPDQAAQLNAHIPQSRGRTVVVADPVLDGLRASGVLRDRYRDALGIGDRRLVVVSSTWGRESLLGRWPLLPAQLLGELDVDGYAVLAVLHPNVLAGHGAWQLRSWLASARDGGLLMVPPEAGWQASLIAGDCLIGDHGSVSLYGAGIDIPLLLAPFGDEVVSDTPMTALRRLSAELAPERPLKAQITAAIETQVPGRYEAAVRGAFAAAPPARSLRSVLYELIDLPEPDVESPLVGWPAPRPDSSSVSSFVIHTRLAGDLIEVRRFPAAVRKHIAETPDGWQRHLAVGDGEWDLRKLQSASTLTRSHPTDVEDAWEWAYTTVDRFPGSVLAAAEIAGGSVAVTRDGRRVQVSAAPGGSTTLHAAVVYALLHSDRLTDADLRLNVGGTVTSIVTRLG